MRHAPTIHGMIETSIRRKAAVWNRRAPMDPLARFVRTCIWIAAWLAIGLKGAAAQVTTGSGDDVILLAELAVLIVLGRLLGEGMLRVGQPAVMGQLLAGIILGPSVLGLIWPDFQHRLFPETKEMKAMLEAISNFGILLLLLRTGMETDLKLARKFGRAAISVSLSGVAIPFVCGTALGAALPVSLLPSPDKRMLTALFLGTALSISSIKIVAAVVRDMNFTRRNLGQLIISSSIIEDTIGWIIISITFGLASASSIDMLGVAKSVVGTALFLIASFTVGRWFVFRAIRFANDNFESDFPVITAILAIMSVMALITNFIGVNTVLGAFVAGLLIGQSPILTRHIDEQLRGLIIAFFMPVFFGVAGLGTHFAVLADPKLLGLTVVLIAAASFGKFAGAFLGAQLGGLGRREALALGFAMNARGSTEVIVASIGLAMGALTPDLFTMIVAMAMTTTMVMPPLLRWGLSRVGISRAEQERLEDEEAAESSFVRGIERMLLAVDDSANGRFASRLAGLIAGARGIPITIVPVGKESGQSPPDDERQPPSPASERGMMQAASVAASGGSEDAAAAKPVEVTIRKADAPDGNAVAREARKGYDLLFIGLEHAYSRSGRFRQDLERMALDFEGPLAIVEAKGNHRGRPEQSGLDVLVPVNGTKIARRGAEVAIMLARVCRAPLQAIYVSEIAGRERSNRKRGARSGWHEQAILKDISELADQYDQRITTAVRSRKAAEDAILSAIGRNDDKLVVMGVPRPAGEPLFFGEIAAAVLERTPASILLISS
jgi:Kef-type K+ transport system membrane component KefB/nucleotide-binding universal stress UspA family protein